MQRFGGGRSVALVGIPHRLHRFHAPRRLGGHIPCGGIERGVAGILLHHFQRRPGRQRVGNVRVPQQCVLAASSRAAPCGAARRSVPAQATKNPLICLASVTVLMPTAASTG